MATWQEFEQQAPELATAIGARFGAALHSILATLRADGSPRVAGLEVHFGDGELWLAMMPDSRKADDLRRDPRFALHTAPDVALVDGDAKVNGWAEEVTDPAVITRFVERLPQPLPPSGMALFRGELTGASLARVDGDHMVIDSWRDGEAARQVHRQ